MGTPAAFRSLGQRALWCGKPRDCWAGPAPPPPHSHWCRTLRTRPQAPESERAALGDPAPGPVGAGASSVSQAGAWASHGSGSSQAADSPPSERLACWLSSSRASLLPCPPARGHHGPLCLTREERGRREQRALPVLLSCLSAVYQVPPPPRRPACCRHPRHRGGTGWQRDPRSLPTLHHAWLGAGSATEHEWASQAGQGGPRGQGGPGAAGKAPRRTGLDGPARLSVRRAMGCVHAPTEGAGVAPRAQGATGEFPRVIVGVDSTLRWAVVPQRLF